MTQPNMESAQTLPKTGGESKKYLPAKGATDPEYFGWHIPSGYLTLLRQRNVQKKQTNEQINLLLENSRTYLDNAQFCRLIRRTGILERFTLSLSADVTS